MDYFKTYVSNTLAGSGNQHVHCPEDPAAVYTGRVYFKVFAGGNFNYSLLFSNILDSTFADGNLSHANLICDQWELVSASLGVVRTCAADAATDPESSFPLTFAGKASKTVMPGEFFTSDPVSICAQKDEYLCLEISWRGRMIPYHEESILPCFVKKDGSWVPGKFFPFPGMIGCDRKVALRVGYIGDSITQGIGTDVNSYDHWNAVLSEKLGDACSYWNLGLGFARGHDAASDSAWLFKARQVDLITVCFGVNDISRITDFDLLCRDLTTIVQTLKAAGVTVVLQTIPPADFQDERADIWLRANDFIRTELSRKADYVFDVVPSLWLDAAHPEKSRIGNCHPRAEGCAAWANALYPVIKEAIEKRIQP